MAFSLAVPPLSPTAYSSAQLQSSLGNPTGRQLIFWDEQNPRSLIRLLPYELATLAKAHASSQPDLFNCDEQELIEKISSDGHKPTPTDHRLRLRFWMEFDYAQSMMLPHIDVMRVIAGLCSFEYFTQKYAQSPSRLAWLLCPTTSYLIKTEESLEFGLDQLREFLAQPNRDPLTGLVDTKLGDLKLKITMMLDARVKGAIVQRTMNLHAHTGTPKDGQALAGKLAQMSMEQLESMAGALHKENESLRQGGALPTGDSGITEAELISSPSSPSA